MTDAIVVGGGLAGLAVGALLASRQHSVVLLEGEARLGGRLECGEAEGFRLGSGLSFGGPEQGAVQRVLNSCGASQGLQFIGSAVGTHYMATGEGIFPQPLTPWLTLTNRYFGLSQRRAYYNLIGAAARSKPARVRANKLTLAQWLQRHAPETRSRDLFLKMATLQTYCAEPAELEAAHFLEYLQSSARNRYGALYLKGGTASLIQTLEKTILTANPSNKVLTTVPVHSVIKREGNDIILTGVRLETGEVLEAKTLILTVPPAALGKLLPPDLAAEIGPLDGLQGASVGRWELGLSQKLPFPTPTLYHLDSQTVITDLSYYDVTLAPSNGQLIQFLSLGQAQDSEKAKAFCMELADKYFKGWRELKAIERWTFQAQAVTAQYTPHQLEKLMPTRSRSAPNLFLAGDWVAAQGELIELVFETAEAAAIAADEYLNQL